MGRRSLPVEGAPVPNTFAAATVHPALLLFAVVQPLLGVAAIGAEGDAVAGPFTQMSLRAPVPMDGRGEAAVEAHEVVGNLFCGVIGLHGAAAPVHRWVRRDDVLQRML